MVRTSAGDVATACGDFYDAVIDDRLRHRGQGALDAAVAGAGTRPNGDAWAGALDLDRRHLTAGHRDPRPVGARRHADPHRSVVRPAP